MTSTSCVVHRWQQQGCQGRRRDGPCKQQASLPRKRKEERPHATSLADYKCKLAHRFIDAVSRIFDYCWCCNFAEGPSRKQSYARASCVELCRIPPSWCVPCCCVASTVSVWTRSTCTCRRHVASLLTRECVLMVAISLKQWLATQARHST